MKLFKKNKEVQQHYVINNIETFKVGDEIYPINVRTSGCDRFNIGDKATIIRINLLIEESECNIEYTFKYNYDIGCASHKNVFKTKEELLKFIATV